MLAEVFEIVLQHRELILGQIQRLHRRGSHVPAGANPLRLVGWSDVSGCKERIQSSDPSCSSLDAGRRAQRRPEAAGCAEEGKPGWRSDKRRRFAEQPGGSVCEPVWEQGVCVCARVYGCVLQLSTEIYVTGLPPPPPAGPLPLNKRPHPTAPNSSEFKGIFWESYRTVTTINSIRSFTLWIRTTITRKWQQS